MREDFACFVVFLCVNTIIYQFITSMAMTDDPKLNEYYMAVFFYGACQSVLGYATGAVTTRFAS